MSARNTDNIVAARLLSLQDRKLFLRVMKCSLVTIGKETTNESCV